MLAYLHVLFAGTTMNWIRRLGGPGLVLLGIADNSVVPLPGSMDVLTVWLAASHRPWWPYYAAMATVGALVGGYITYGLARKGGKEALEAKLSKDRAKTVYARFERWGFGAVAVPALLPPPFPIVPFLLAAGALQYSRKKFLAALALGRGIRFTLVAGLGAIYGKQIVAFFSKYYKPALLTLIGLAVVAGIFALLQYRRFKKHRTSRPAVRPRAA
jgi:membrane protein YqaA with SNARE-associated domain